MNRQGSMLVGLLFLLAFTLIIGVPVLHAAATINQTSVNNQLQAQAFYVAEAGVQRAYNIIAGMEYSELPAVGAFLFTFSIEDQPMATGWYTVSARLISDTDIEIISVGNAGGSASAGGGYSASASSSRKLSLKPKVGPPGGSGGPLDATLFAADSIDFSGSSWVTGNVVSNTSRSKSITMPGTTQIRGNLTIGPNAIDSIVLDLTQKKNPRPIAEAVTVLPVKNLSSVRTYPDYNLPAFPTNLDHLGSYDGVLPIISDVWYDSISVSSTLVINVGNDVRKIRVGSLSFPKGNGKINLVGAGRLELYIDTDMTPIDSGNAINKLGDPNRVAIYYAGTRTFEVSGDGLLNGSVYAASANVLIANSGNSVPLIVTKGSAVTVSGGVSTDMLLYAPKAAVQLLGSASVHGAVVCKSVLISGNSSIVKSDSAGLSYSKLFPGSGSIEISGSTWTSIK